MLDIANLEQQLDDATWGFLEWSHGVAATVRRVALPAFMQWTAGDFGGEAGMLLFVGGYMDLADITDCRMGYRDYDWRLGQVQIGRGC